MNEVDNTAESNEGLNRRSKFTNNGAEVGLVGEPLPAINQNPYEGKDHPSRSMKSH